VHNLSGDAAVALHPAEHQRQGRWKAVTLNPQTKRSTSQTQLVKQDFRQTGKPRLAQDTAMIIDHCTPEKYRMECVGKTCCAAAESAACRKYVSWSWRRDLNP
jgi:hypothetical protein